MDLHDHFAAYADEHSMSTSATSDSAQARQLEQFKAIVRHAWYAGAQAAQSVMTEVSTNTNYDAAAVSTAMVRLQRQTQEGMRE